MPRVAVNLFADQLRRRTLPADMADILWRTGLAASDVELEVTETIVLEPEGDVLDDLRTLRTMGVDVALDDFGTGFACLATLRKLPLTCLKIDRSFVSELREGSADLAVVRAVFQIGRELALRVVAEGVETEAQALRLERLGCAHFQGHLGSRPLPPQTFAARFAPAALPA